MMFGFISNMKIKLTVGYFLSYFLKTKVHLRVEDKPLM